MGIPERTLPAWMTRSCRIPAQYEQKKSAGNWLQGYALVKPKRRKDYKQRITDHQRQQLVYELKSRGFDGSEKEVDLLLRGGSIPSEQACVSSIGTSVCRKMIWRNLY